jgi:2-hydroxy-4-carboxymuconate semialdehyde hemiacetal dehydrogenase
MHAKQTEQCLRAGKHVQVEIPMADNLADAERVARLQQETGLVAMAGHTRRFNPSHQWIRKRIQAGELEIQQMDVQTYFFRRTNMNALGKPRSWTDHLLWHHACHTVDLFQYQTGEVASQVFALQGPMHPQLKIAMDMSIGMKVPSGAICTLSLSFNNDGPLGTFFRYICDNGTYIARYDELLDGKGNAIDVSKVDVSMNGIELQDREFFAAIREGREPNASVRQVLPAMQTLDRLERALTSSA